MSLQNVSVPRKQDDKPSFSDGGKKQPHREISLNVCQDAGELILLCNHVQGHWQETVNTSTQLLPMSCVIQVLLVTCTQYAV